MLEMDGVVKKDAGTYTCVATNKYGEKSEPCTLMVTEDEKEAEDWAAALKKT